MNKMIFTLTLAVLITIINGESLVGVRSLLSGDNYDTKSIQQPKYCHITPTDYFSKKFNTALDHSVFTTHRITKADKKFRAFVAVIYVPENTKQMEIALHIRNPKAGNNKLGLPGGSVDKIGETMKEGAFRELKEEAANNMEDVKIHHLQLIHGSVKDDKSVYALYAMFVDKPLLKGPDEKHSGEVKENKNLKFVKENGYHRFLQIQLTNKGKVEIIGEHSSELNKMLWTFTAQSLVRVLQNVKCDTVSKGSEYESSGSQHGLDDAGSQSGLGGAGSQSGSQHGLGGAGGAGGSDGPKPPKKRATKWSTGLIIAVVISSVAILALIVGGLIFLKNK